MHAVIIIMGIKASFKKRGMSFPRDSRPLLLESPL